MTNCRVGQVRPSQLLWTYGPGALIDLPNLSAISLEVLKYLRHFQRSSYAEAKKARPATGVRNEVEILMQGYFTYLLERELNSPGFLRAVRPSSASPNSG